MYLFIYLCTYVFIYYVCKYVFIYLLCIYLFMCLSIYLLYLFIMHLFILYVCIYLFIMFLFIYLLIYLFWQSNSNPLWRWRCSVVAVIGLRFGRSKFISWQSHGFFLPPTPNTTFGAHSAFRSLCTWAIYPGSVGRNVHLTTLHHQE